MVLRWVAHSLSDAATWVRKLRGCTHMRSLIKALEILFPDLVAVSADDRADL